MHDLLHGWIDSYHIKHNIIIITGWAFYEKLGLVPLLLAFNNKIIEAATLKRFDRPDVINLWPDAPLCCGFQLCVPSYDADEVVPSGIDVLAVIDDKLVPLRKGYNFLSKFNNIIVESAETNNINRQIIIQKCKKDEDMILPSDKIKKWTYKDIKDTPSMEEESINLFGELLIKDNTIFLEYGAGGITIYAARRRVKIIHSVESDKFFLHAVNERIKKEFEDIRLFSHYIDIGNTKELGYPVSADRKHMWVLYPLSPWADITKLGCWPSVILIDGRFRIACFLACLLFAKNDTVLLFDDYLNRRHYHVVENFLKPQKFAGRMAVFIINDNDYNQLRDKIWRELVEQSHDPR